MSSAATPAPVAAAPIEATASGVNEKGEKGFWTATGEFFTDGAPQSRNGFPRFFPPHILRLSFVCCIIQIFPIFSPRRLHNFSSRGMAIPFIGLLGCPSRMRLLKCVSIGFTRARWTVGNPARCELPLFPIHAFHDFLRISVRAVTQGCLL